MSARQGPGPTSRFWEEAALVADPDTGELTPDGSIPDLYRERAMALHGQKAAT